MNWSSTVEDRCNGIPIQTLESPQRAGGRCFRTVAGRCALNLSQLPLALTRPAILRALQTAGCVELDLDPVSVARSRIGQSRYTRGARLAQAPEVVDCSSFTKWVYAQCGIWLPRRSIQQRLVGYAVSMTTLRPGDLVFTNGARNYSLAGLPRPVGHVGIATECATVVHAAAARLGVQETGLSAFTRSGRIFSGAVRIIPEGADLLVLSTPSEWEVEGEDDLHWILARLTGAEVELVI
ncbi:MAG: NlpC/P60 family protein [Patescibacteria group bacterium]